MLPFIDHAVVVGEGKKYISLLLVPKLQKTDTGEETILLTDSALYVVNNMGSDAKNVVDLMDDPVIKGVIDRAVQSLNKTAASPVQTIKKWVMVPKVFTEKGGELTATMKLRRKAVYTKYSQYIDGLY